MAMDNFGMRVPGTRAANTNSRGRSRGTLDAGMVALSISTMNFYWTLPLLLDHARARREQRARDAAQDRANQQA